MKKMAVLTRDCAGVNTAIRSVVRMADHKNIEVIGVLRGYEGLIKGEFVPLSRRDVSGILNLGGSILKTARSKDFRTEKGQKQAVRFIKEQSLDGLIVIGGNGSLSAAHILADRYGLPVVGIPATIDNDVNGVDMTIGTDTAVNVAVDALDKIRDTAFSLERLFVVEVMGRLSGYIALQVALAGGCEEVLLPEREHDLKAVCREILKGNARGKVSWIIIVAEGRASAPDVARIIREETGLETRVAVLGHIQRGGRPTALDRILASKLGAYAVEVLCQGKSDVCVSYNNNIRGTIPLAAAVKDKTFDVEAEYQLIKILT
jgi:6-phosphofructokinase 1